VTGYHRKHAIRVLTAQVDTQRERSVGHRIYREAVKEALIVLWEASDRICGKRLKALLPLLDFRIGTASNFFFAVVHTEVCEPGEGGGLFRSSLGA